MIRPDAMASLLPRGEARTGVDADVDSGMADRPGWDEGMGGHKGSLTS